MLSARLLLNCGPQSRHGGSTGREADAASIYRRDQSRLWWATQREHHRLLISPEVLTELMSPAYPHRDLALNMTVNAEVLPLTQESRGLAKILVAEKVMPKLRARAVHFAGRRNNRPSPESRLICRPSIAGLSSMTGEIVPSCRLTSITCEAPVSNSTVGHAV